MHNRALILSNTIMMIELVDPTPRFSYCRERGRAAVLLGAAGRVGCRVSNKCLTATGMTVGVCVFEAGQQQNLLGICIHPPTFF